MKNIYILLLLLMLGAACNDESLPVVVPENTGTWTDPATGEVYGWVRIGDQEWMTSNLKYGEPYYEQEYEGGFVDNVGEPQDVDTMEAAFDYEGDIEKNGNLYTWEQALEAAPAGWRLPTDEDWQQLEQFLGMSQGAAVLEGWRGEGVATLMRQGEGGTGLQLSLSGYVCLSGRTQSLTLYNGDFGYMGSYNLQ